MPIQTRCKNDGFGICIVGLYRSVGCTRTPHKVTVLAPMVSPSYQRSVHRKSWKSAAGQDNTWQAKSPGSWFCHSILPIIWARETLRKWNGYSVTSKSKSTGHKNMVVVSGQSAKIGKGGERSRHSHCPRWRKQVIIRVVPEKCTWASESTSTAASNAPTPLSHLGGWKVLHRFSDASRTHRLTTTPECPSKAHEQPQDDWQWSKPTRRNRFVGSAKCI